MASRLLVGEDLNLTSTTFLQDLIRSLVDNAEKYAIEFPAKGLMYTYRDVHEKSSAISAELQRRGLKAGDIVMVVSPSTDDALIFIIGIWLSGAASACINPHVPTDEIRYFLEMIRSKVIFCDEAFLEKVQQASEGLDRPVTLVSPNGQSPVNDYFKWLKKAELVTHVEQPLGMDHTILICFTSGTTGRPKGSIITDNCLKVNSYGMTSVILGDKVLLSGPLFWISSPLSISGAVMNGCCMIQLNSPTPEILLYTITTCKPTFWFTGTSVVQLMSRCENLDRYDTSSFLRVIVGGSVLHTKQKRTVVQKVFGNRNVVRNIYGCTECGLVSLEHWEYPFDSPHYSALGQPIIGATIKIVDPETGSLLGPNVPGEICSKTVGIMKSYLDRKPTEQELDKDGFWHLGDMGYYDEQGVLHYKSRLKDVLKYREYMIAPPELEAVIEKHPDVLEAAVVGKPSPEFGDIPTAFVVSKPESSVTEEEISDFVAEQVIDQKRLRGGVHFINSLPRNPSGKILRTELVKMLTVQ